MKMSVSSNILFLLLLLLQFAQLVLQVENKKE